MVAGADVESALAMTSERSSSLNINNNSKGSSSSSSCIRLIVSASNGSVASKALVGRKWRVLVHQTGLNSLQRSSMAMKYLSQFGKSLDERQLSKVIGAQQTSLPLYLKVLLDGMVELVGWIGLD